tara:strand:+ start:2171 stop:2839 length:669 start_codon:yes stop_codon:yes gene_type:complete
MNTIDDDNKENNTNYWDQVETAPGFNKGLTGKKLISAGHLKAEKPGETDWFRVYGEKAADLIPGLLVDVKVDVIDQKFLVIGPDEFKQQIVDGFKKAKSVYLAYFATSSGRQGVWPVTVPEPDMHGNINAYVQTAFAIMERAQHSWTQMKTNQGDRVYDGWVAEKTDQEMFGDPQFLLTQQEANKKAFNDRVIAPDTYEDNPYVMRVLNARTIETGIEKDKI